MEEKITNIKERILQISDFYKVGKEYFFTELGISYGNFKGKSKNTAVNSDFLAEILTKYADINPNWLILGKGEMLKERENLTISEPPVFYKTEDNIKDKYIEVLEENRELHNELRVLLKSHTKSNIKKQNNCDSVCQM